LENLITPPEARAITFRQSKYRFFTSDTLCLIHDTLGLNWWSCIALSTLVLRFVMMLPAQIIAQKVTFLKMFPSHIGIRIFFKKNPLLKKRRNKHKSFI